MKTKCTTQKSGKVELWIRFSWPQLYTSVTITWPRAEAKCIERGFKYKKCLLVLHNDLPSFDSCHTRFCLSPTPPHSFTLWTTSLFLKMVLLLKLPEMFWCSGLSQYCASLTSGLWFQKVYQFCMNTPLEKLLDLFRKQVQTPHFTPAYVIFSISKQQNCIYTCLLYFPSHDSICWHYPWIEKQVCIRQYLARWQS